MINFIFDFDSTLTKTESLNDILKIAINDNEEKIKIIDDIVKNAMEGKITPKDSMNQRLNIIKINKEIIENIKKNIVYEITDRIDFVIEELQKYKNVNIFIISGGFNEIIYPVAEKLKINKNNIFANDFIYKNDIVIGVKDNILLEEQGKVKMINKLKNYKILIGKNIMIGDGWTDLETELFQAVDKYICFTAIAKRERVIKNSKIVINDSIELLNKCREIINNENK